MRKGRGGSVPNTSLLRVVFIEVRGATMRASGSAHQNWAAQGQVLSRYRLTYEWKFHGGTIPKDGSIQDQPRLTPSATRVANHASPETLTSCGS